MLNFKSSLNESVLVWNKFNIINIKSKKKNKIVLKTKRLKNLRRYLPCKRATFFYYRRWVSGVLTESHRHCDTITFTIPLRFINMARVLVMRFFPHGRLVSRISCCCHITAFPFTNGAGDGQCQGDGSPLSCDC